MNWRPFRVGSLFFSTRRVIYEARTLLWRSKVKQRLHRSLSQCGLPLYLWQTPSGRCFLGAVEAPVGCRVAHTTQRGPRM